MSEQAGRRRSAGGFGDGTVMERGRSKHPLRPQAPSSARETFWDLLMETTDPDTALELIRSHLDAQSARSWIAGAAPASENRPGPGAGGASLLRRAEELLEAWKAARRRVDAARQDLDIRTREAALLQDLARLAADAQSPQELLEASARLLMEHVGASAAAAVFHPRTSPEGLVLQGRPGQALILETLLRHTARAVGMEPTALRLVRHLRAEVSAPSPHAALPEDPVLLVPVIRGGLPEAALAFWAPARAGHADARVWFAVANAVLAHLDRLETRERMEEARLHAVLESMPLGVVLLDTEWRVRWANPAAGALGVTRDGGLIEAAVSALPSGTAGAGFREVEVRSGERIYDVTLGPVGPPGEVPAHWLAIFADVTERRRIQEQMAQTEKLSSLGQMLSGVAHELNNPLAAVIGYAQLVSRRAEEPRTRRRLELLQQEAERCRRIVRGLLTFVRPHRPKVGKVFVNEVLEATARLVRYGFRNAGVRLELDLAASLPPVEADAHELQQAVLNLLTNARQAMESAGGTGTVRLSSSRSSSGRVSVEVRDDGPGIPPELRRRVFDPFFTTKEPGEGTGLGLSLVRSIAERHGGSVRCTEGLEGRGAGFVLELPAAPVAPAETEVPAPARSPGRAARRAGQGRVLVIEDEPPVAQCLRDALEWEGYQVRVAASLAEADALMGVVPFHVLVADVRIPAGDAGDLSQWLEGIPADRRPSLVLVTGDTVSRGPEALAERWRAPLLYKPFDLEALVQAVGKGASTTRGEP